MHFERSQPSSSLKISQKVPELSSIVSAEGYGRRSSRGDVVLVDLGMAAKVRPCVVVSISQPDRQRNMSVVVPMTTEIRGGEYETPLPNPPRCRRNPS